MSVQYGTQLIGNGTVSTPSIRFTNSDNTGLYLSSTNNLDVTTNGVNRLNVSTTSITSTLPHLNPVGSVSAPSYSFTGRINTGIYSSTSDNIDITTSGVQRMTISNAAVTMTSRPYQTLNNYASTSGYLALAPQTSRTVSSADAVRAVSTWTNRTTLGLAFRGVCWSPELGLFCAVASAGGNSVMTSSDGVVWTSRAVPVNNQWWGVCWAPELGLFCAVATSGTDNRVMTSPNGITWTTRTNLTNHTWRSICWAPELGLFCAVADTGNGTGNRVTTSQDGITWTSRTTPVDNNGWVGVCWSPELGLFCATSTSGTGNRVMTSPDGIIWTSRTTPVDNNWASVCWAPELGLFCAVATSGTGNRVMTSPDGITWTSRNTPVQNYLSVCWAPELGLFCAFRNGGTVLTSPDGIIWTSRTGMVDIQYHAVCWSPELGMVCAVSFTGSSNRITTSRPLRLLGNTNVSSGVVSVSNGFVTAPSLTFQGNPTTGLYSSGVGNVDISVDGTLRATANTFGLIATCPLSHKSASVLQVPRTSGNSAVVSSSTYRVLAGQSGNTVDGNVTLNAFNDVATTQGTDISWTSSTGNITINPSVSGMYMFVIQLWVNNLNTTSSGFVELILTNLSTNVREINLLLPCNAVSGQYRLHASASVSVSTSTVFRCTFQQTSGTNSTTIDGGSTIISALTVCRLLG